MPRYTKMIPKLILYFACIAEKRVLRINKIDTIRKKAVTESGYSKPPSEGNNESWS